AADRLGDVQRPARGDADEPRHGAQRQHRIRRQSPPVNAGRTSNQLTHARSVLAGHGLVEPADLFRPLPAFWMRHRIDLLARPVEVIGDEGYLADDGVQGVAYDSPTGSSSMSNFSSQCGQTTACFVDPCSLMRL